MNFRSNSTGFALVAFAAVWFLGKAAYLPAGASADDPLGENDLPINLVVHTPVPLTNDLIREDWEFFTSANYFGAFAYNAVEQTYDFYTGLASIEQAKNAALKLCASESERPLRCEIYAELHPKVQIPILPRRMSREAEFDFATRYQTGRTFWTYSAFAINENGDYGWSKRYSTAFAARNAAMGFCEFFAAKTRAEKTDVLATLLTRSKALTCKIVDEN